MAVMVVAVWKVKGKGSKRYFRRREYGVGILRRDGRRRIGTRKKPLARKSGYHLCGESEITGAEPVILLERTASEIITC